MKKRIQPGPKPFVGWALYNWGHPWGVFTTRKAAIQEATYQTSSSWREAREAFRIAKVKVTPSNGGEHRG